MDILMAYIVAIMYLALGVLAILYLDAPDNRYMTWMEAAPDFIKVFLPFVWPVIAVAIIYARWIKK